MKDFPFRAILGFLGLVWFFTLRLAAQQLAVLNIAVTEPTGSVISYAKVSLRNTDTEANRTDFSSGAGLASDTVYGTPAFLGPVSRKFGDGIGSLANPTFGRRICRCSQAGANLFTPEFLTIVLGCW